VDRQRELRGCHGALEHDEAASDRFEVDGFFVEGRYRVVEKLNNAQAASEAFKALEAG